MVLPLMISYDSTAASAAAWREISPLFIQHSVYLGKAAIIDANAAEIFSRVLFSCTRANAAAKAGLDGHETEAVACLLCLQTPFVHKVLFCKVLSSWMVPVVRSASRGHVKSL